MIKIHSKEELDEYLSKNTSVLAVFYSTWCPYCIRFVPFFDKMTTESQFAVIHVLIEDDDNSLWDEYNIPAVPTVILFEEGKVQDRLDASLGTGLNQGQFIEWLNKLKK